MGLYPAAPAQAWRADNVLRQIYRLLPRITETRFPVPGFKVIAEFAHLTAQAGIKVVKVLGRRKISETSFDTAIGNSGGDSHSGIRAARRQDRIRDRETD